MRKPNNYDTTTTFGEFTPLAPGGYVCEVKKVEETKSSNGRDMIKIFLDIAEGEQKGYYAKMYKSDTRPEKKWRCIVYQLVEDNEGNTNKGFKTFINAVAKSNDKFDENSIWNDNFSSYFKGTIVGGVFGREQYESNDGALKWSTKCVQFRTVEAVRDGVEPPEDKYLKKTQKSSNNGLPTGYEAIDDDDLPF